MLAMVFNGPGAHGRKNLTSISKEGKSICFTDAVLYQNDVLIATSSATNKLVDNPF